MVQSKKRKGLEDRSKSVDVLLLDKKWRNRIERELKQQRRKHLEIQVEDDSVNNFLYQDRTSFAQWTRSNFSLFIFQPHNNQPRHPFPLPRIIYFVGPMGAHSSKSKQSDSSSSSSQIDFFDLLEKEGENALKSLSLSDYETIFTSRDQEGRSLVS